MQFRLSLLVVAVVALFVSVVSPPHAFAQLGPELVANERAAIYKLEQSASARTGGGLVLAILGAGAIAGGGYFLVQGSQPVEETGNPLDDIGEAVGNGGELIAGMALAMLGTGAVVTGVVVFASGQSRRAEAKRRKHQLRFGPRVDGGFSMSLSGSF